MTLTLALLALLLAVKIRVDTYYTMAATDTPHPSFARVRDKNRVEKKNTNQERESEDRKDECICSQSMCDRIIIHCRSPRKETETEKVLQDQKKREKDVYVCSLHVVQSGYFWRRGRQEGKIHSIYMYPIHRHIALLLSLVYSCYTLFLSRADIEMESFERE